MPIRLFKYLSPLLLYYGAMISFFSTGFIVWLPLIYAWWFIPLLEFFLKADTSNLSQAEEEIAKSNKWYDVVLYMIVPLQFIALFIFLYNVGHYEYRWIDIVGKTLVMGLLCGTLGINVGHELGHRVNKFEQVLAKMLLLTSLYMHFFIEHNKGHHKKVATPEDPSSARYGEMLYSFYFRSIIYSYISAWKISFHDMRKKQKAHLSWHNQMLQFHVIQLTFVLLIFFFFGLFATLLFIAAAINGVLLLETVNYIEHYGLQRREIAAGKYERTLPNHSWNSNHVIGRVMLFELSRHSDHHYMASRKYQVLKHHDNSPQMPTGYPGMMLLASIPHLWFYVMNKRVRSIMNKDPESIYFANRNRNPITNGDELPGLADTLK